MMRRLLGALGVDYDQWRALTAVMIKVDLRAGAQLAQASGTDRSSQRTALIMQGVFYGVMGLFLVAMAFLPDVFVGATMMLTAVMFFVGAMVLIEYQAVVISPDDYQMLGFQPLSSRTYFAVKLTNVFVYVATIATLMGAPSIVAHLLRGGIGRGVAALAAVYGATAFITLAMVVAYAMVLRFVHPKRLRRALSYLQMLLGIVMYGGYALFPRLVDREALLALSAGAKTWILLYPPAWFASFLDISAGEHGVTELLPAAVAIVSLAALFLYSTERLSLSYAARLSELVSTSESPSRKRTPRDRRSASTESAVGGAAPRRALATLHGETRAMALLMRAQFRYDMKFRMAVLGIVPITLLYVFMSLHEGTLPDPFVDAEFGGVQGLGLLHLAMFFLPVMLLESLARSDSFRAAWIFFATPADKSRLILAAKNIIVAFVGVPYLLFLCAIFAWFFDALSHAVTHTVILGLVANLFLQVAVAMRPRLPFARPLGKGQTSASLMLLMFVTVGVIVGVLPPLLSYLYADPDRTILAGTMLLFANVVAGNGARRRARRRTETLQFSA
jgi:hypothetical protein